MWSRTTSADLLRRDTEAVRVLDHSEKGLVDGPLSHGRVVVDVADELSAQYPHVINVFLDRLRRQVRRCKVFEERPSVQIPAVMLKAVAWRGSGAVCFGSSRRHQFPLHAAAHHD